MTAQNTPFLPQGRDTDGLEGVCRYLDCPEPTFAFLDPKFCSREHRDGRPLNPAGAQEQNVRMLLMSDLGRHDRNRLGAVVNAYYRGDPYPFDAGELAA